MLIMKVIGMLDNLLDQVDFISLMVHILKDHFKEEILLDKMVYMFTLMVLLKEVILSMENQRDMVDLFHEVVSLPMKEIGSTTNQTVKEYKFILMVQDIKVNLLMVLKMITMQFIDGRMEKLMQVLSRMDICKAMESYR